MISPLETEHPIWSAVVLCGMAGWAAVYAAVMSGDFADLMAKRGGGKRLAYWLRAGASLITLGMVMEILILMERQTYANAYQGLYCGGLIITILVLWRFHANRMGPR